MGKVRAEAKDQAADVTIFPVRRENAAQLLLVPTISFHPVLPTLTAVLPTALKCGSKIQTLGVGNKLGYM